jgi:hypothetical protein
MHPHSGLDSQTLRCEEPGLAAHGKKRNRMRPVLSLAASSHFHAFQSFQNPCTLPRPVRIITIPSHQQSSVSLTEIPDPRAYPFALHALNFNDPSVYHGSRSANITVPRRTLGSTPVSAANSFCQRRGLAGLCQVLPCAGPCTYFAKCGQRQF